MSRDPIPTWFFVVVVVRDGDKFLLVQERKHGQTWYLPAGRVEPCEELDDAARREALEETGMTVVLEGILRIEHWPQKAGTSRVRVIYLARASRRSGPIKTQPDEHSTRAAWVNLSDVPRLTLRSPDVVPICRYAAGNPIVYPLGVVVPEGAPYPGQE